MNLSAMLSSRIQNNRPVRVGLIGAGKFGSMILSQARHINGLHIMAVADLDLNKAQDSFQRVGWDTKSCFAGSSAEAVISGKTWLTDNAADICALSELDCIIEATGHPLFGVRHVSWPVLHGSFFDRLIPPQQGQNVSSRPAQGQTYTNLKPPKAIRWL